MAGGSRAAVDLDGAGVAVLGDERRAFLPQWGHADLAEVLQRVNVVICQQAVREDVTRYMNDLVHPVLVNQGAWECH